MESSIQILREAIYQAFITGIYPGDGNISESVDYWEHDEILFVFAGKHWTDISVDTILVSPYLPSYLTSDAFRFYIPAYMMAGLYNTKDYSYSYYAVLHLSDCLGAEHRHYFDSFNLKQCDAVIMYLSWAIKAFPDMFAPIGCIGPLDNVMVDAPAKVLTEYWIPRRDMLKHIDAS